MKATQRSVPESLILPMAGTDQVSPIVYCPDELRCVISQSGSGLAGSVTSRAQ